MTPQEFVEKWKGRRLSERGGSHVHFIELCQVLDVPYPHQNRADDADYCFDALTDAAGSRMYAAAARKGPKAGRRRKEPGPALFAGDGHSSADQPDGGALNGPERNGPATPRIVSAKSEGHGWADVWKRACFCWEYKRQGRHADLGAALVQLKTYKDSLDNPPLLVVCDVDHFEVHTNFTGHPTEVHEFSLEDLGATPESWRERGVSPLVLLRYAFTDPEWFRPKKTVNDVTEELAGKIAEIARSVEGRKDDKGKRLDPHDVAHFLMQTVFAMFAEDVGLLPARLVTEVIKSNTNNPDRFQRQMRALFRTMESGGDFGTHGIEHFNGGLFRNLDSQRVPRLAQGEIGQLSIVAEADWSAVEPSILGTLFERSLNPDKRAQIGAHYTSRDDIMLIIEPVILAPLRRQWADVKSRVESGKADGDAIRAFAKRLASLKVLDPACGSGNFLYVAIQCLLDLEKQVILYGSARGIALHPKVNPTQLHGIEINDYAAELARISIWIGFLKWHRENGKTDPGRRPILDKLDTIEQRDAILSRATDSRATDFVGSETKSVPTTRKHRDRKADLGGTKSLLATPAPWPRADFIIGNPPFLGAKFLRKAGLTDKYVADLFEAYDLPRESDLCCYWFEEARRAIEKSPATRVGLLATQGIRGDENRVVLERIKKSGDLFMAWADRDWVLDGAAVHVSMVGFDNGAQTDKQLDGQPVNNINTDLSSGADLTGAKPLMENAGVYVRSPEKGAPFEVPWNIACQYLAAPNPNKRPNADVLHPWINGEDLVGGRATWWIIDYPSALSEADAAKYELPFRHVATHVEPKRSANSDARMREAWWVFRRTGEGVRAAARRLPRLLGTTMVSKHRLFAWIESGIQPDKTIPIFARGDDYFLGALHSSIHEVWARRTGTQLREVESGFRYTPTSCFETLPLPWPPGKEPAKPSDKHHALHQAIAAAARELNELRENWLNPPEWIAAVEKLVDLRYRAQLAAVPADVHPLIRRSAVMAEAAKDAKLKARTLTNLYNQRPAWLRLAHEKLDRAVLAAYRAIDPKGAWDPDWAAAYEPFGAGEITIKTTGKSRDPDPVIAAKQSATDAREPIDAKILANLLRLNQQRAGGQAKSKPK